MSGYSEHALGAGDGRAILQERVDRIADFQGWEVGNCRAGHLGLGSAVYEVFDREGRAHWLQAGPWREWQRLVGLWDHLRWVGGVLASTSHLFRLMGNMVPVVTWKGVEEGFIGLSEKVPSQPYLSTLSASNPPRFEHLVQLTGFLRLLQTGDNPFDPSEIGARLKNVERCARERVLRVRARLPDKPVFKRWESFYLQNAFSISRSACYRLTLSLGEYAAGCFAGNTQGGLFVDLPFVIGQDLEDLDLCRILHLLADVSTQDLQYLVDLYFNMDTPPHFFTLYSHFTMTAALDDLSASDPASKREAASLDRLSCLSRQHDLFRSPVPCWYL